MFEELIRALSTAGWYVPPHGVMAFVVPETVAEEAVTINHNPVTAQTDGAVKAVGSRIDLNGSDGPAIEYRTQQLLGACAARQSWWRPSKYTNRARRAELMGKLGSSVLLWGSPVWNTTKKERLEMLAMQRAQWSRICRVPRIWNESDDEYCRRRNKFVPDIMQRDKVQLWAASAVFKQMSFLGRNMRRPEDHLCRRLLLLRNLRYLRGLYFQTHSQGHKRRFPFRKTEAVCVDRVGLSWHEDARDKIKWNKTCADAARDEALELAQINDEGALKKNTKRQSRV